MLTEHAKAKSMTSLTPNIINPLEGREMLKDWRLNIHFPPVNVSKNEKWFTIEMAIPGMSEKNIKVTVEDDVLIVRAKKQEKTKETTKEFTHQEYNYRSFKRSFSIPEKIDIEKIETNYKKGILKIRVPKTD